MSSERFKLEGTSSPIAMLFIVFVFFFIKQNGQEDYKITLRWAEAVPIS